MTLMSLHSSERSEIFINGKLNHYFFGDQRTYQRGAEKTTYLPQELDAGLWIPWPSPLLEVVHVEKACVQACPGPPKLAPLHEVVVGKLDVLLAAPSRGPEPRGAVQ